MHKVKKKVKPGKIPKPIKIKKEKTEEDRTLHPMSHYIDDRLELVKQIFGSLKPKTITNLAPDFLKKMSMDEIEELCLNELLGISTKRLLSIINATKCPTDTESSSDSDIEHQEEHISLEEISSDSEIEGSSSNAGKKKSSGTKGKTGAKKTTKNSAEKDEDNGQISVLELLELQARARAIRSQLALEPVTKIEVDSDGETKDVKTHIQKFPNGTDTKEHKRKRRHETSEKSKTADKTQTYTTSQNRPLTIVKSSKTATITAVDTPTTSNAKVKVREVEMPPSKADKSKRSYRAKIHGSDVATNEKENKSKNSAKDTAPLGNTIVEIKKEAKSHSPTPDVIPIIPEPETLLITDSSDPENDRAEKKKNRKTETVKNNSVATQKDAAQKESAKDEKEKSNGELTEREEGEVVEKQIENCKEQRRDEDKSKTKEANNDVSSSSEPVKEKKETAAFENLVKAEEKGVEKASKTENNKSEVAGNKSKTDTKTAGPKKTSTTAPPPPTQPSNVTSNLEYEDDRNDDVISLEGGDLEEEMIEHLGKDANTKSSFVNSSKKCNNVSEEQDSDVISLDSSEPEDERDKESSESWHARYLKSSKVSKVLAASRLGKRMRDNIKMSKRSKKDAERVKAPEEKEKSGTSYVSKHEDGSVEQYKELMAMRQRKK